MTVQRVKEILGDQIYNMSDQDISDFISGMGLICDEILNDIVSQLTSNKDEPILKI